MSIQLVDIVCLLPCDRLAVFFDWLPSQIGCKTDTKYMKDFSRLDRGLSRTEGVFA